MEIEVTAAIECPFYYEERGDTTEAGTYIGGDDKCTIMGDDVWSHEDCPGFMNKSCPLLNGPILICGKEVQ
ncbi:MAG: hypothetical protein JRE23_18440 [Deltaproteobacteria bacterium]|nr:hypothetical protein [Deltaproteobacteria bacterium]